MKIRIFVSACCFAALVGCGPNPDNGAAVNGNDHSSISGKLLLSDGKSPASGVVVTVRPRDVTAPIVGGAVAKIKAGNRAVLTGADGNFSIDSCPPGVYVIEGADAQGKAVRIDSVIVRDTDKTTEVPPQSLQAMGAIRGNVALSGGGDPGNVFILAFGSDRFAQAQSDGKFFMGDLPYGKYDLKIVCVLTEYGACKTMSISVAPGDTADIDTLVFERQELCIPTNFTLHYDTIMQTVTLHWDSCTGSNVRGYNVFRYDTAETYTYGDQPLNAKCITAKCSYYDDSIFINRSYVYGVAVVSKDGTIGRKSKALSVTTKILYRFDTLYGPNGYGLNGVGAAAIGISSISWNSDNRLVIAYSLKSQMSIIDYASDFSIMRRSDITLPFNYCRNVYVDGENVYLEKSETEFDSSIYCFTRDGTMKQVYRFHAPIEQYIVRNDTVVALSDSGIVLFFDTAGQLLFNRKIGYEGNGSYGFDKLTGEGNFFTVNNTYDTLSGTGRWELHKIDLMTMNEATFASGSEMMEYINVRGDLYLYGLYNQYGMGSMVVADRNNGCVARLPDMQFKGVINSRGQIAYVQSNGGFINRTYCIVVLTPL